MWRNVRGDERSGYVSAAGDLMRAPGVFRAAMARAIEEWPRSCEHNLTSMASNRIAWLGHAGCCLAVQSPEDLTRLAWHTLTAPQQDEANRVAAEVLAVWEERHGQG